MNSTVNGRFEQPADEDWYRFKAEAGKGVIFQTLAQRHLRCRLIRPSKFTTRPARTAENDDGSLFMGQVYTSSRPTAD
jgi:hypothetical protein